MQKEKFQSLKKKQKNLKKRKKERILEITRGESDYEEDFNEDEFEDEFEERELCFKPEEREEQVNEITKLRKYSLDLYEFTKFQNERVTKDSYSNEDYFNAIKTLSFIASHFDKDFEEVIQYYKDKFGYEKCCKDEFN